jgi:hypothetical protein
MQLKNLFELGSKRDFSFSSTGAFDGGRKCIPRFCGGMEDIILKQKSKFII